MERLSHVLPDVGRCSKALSPAWRRKVRGAPSKLTEAELLRYRSTVYGMAAAMGRVPRMSFGRDRYGMAAAAVQVRPVVCQLTGEPIK